jgi:1-phosphofructokinase family hexose kinase
MIVCVSANPSIDKLFVVDRLTQGSIHRPVEFVQLAGGKGLNVARAAASLGADISAVALLGGFAGKWIAQALESEGIPVHVSWTGAETRSCLSVADASTADLTEFYENGHEVEAEAWERLQALVEEVSASANWFIFSGSLPRGVPADGYAGLMDAARRQGAAVALDTRDESLTRALEARPTVVKINAAEAGDVLHIPVTSVEESLIAARGLRRRSGGIAAIVTRGAEGAIADTESGCWHVYSRVRGPYPVGSGDAFLAGLITGLDRGDDWRQALALAFGAGAANAEVPGTGCLLPARAEAIAADTQIVQLAHSADE